MDESFIVGHEFQRDALTKLIASNRLPTALLFSGMSGVGKLRVAFELARTLLCEQAALPEQHGQPARGGCGRCDHCRMLTSQTHPDLHLVQCLSKEDSNMAAVRELLYTLNLRSHSSRGRIVIFNDAEHLSLQAANAILKTLEEPRPFTHFVLIAASPSKLPATIVSRCQVWCFDSLSAGQIQEILTHRERSASAEGPAQSIPPSELAELADGSLDSLDQIGAHYERWMTIKDLLARMLEGDLEIALRAAQDLGKSKESLRAQIHLLRIRSRQQMHSPRGSATARTRTQRRWATLLSNLIAAERLIFERNLSPVLVLSAVFAAFTTQHQSFALAELPNLEDIVV